MLTNIHPMNKRLKYVITELNLLEKDVLLDVKVKQIKRQRLCDVDRLKLLVLNMRFEGTGIRHEVELAFH